MVHTRQVQQLFGNFNRTIFLLYLLFTKDIVALGCMIAPQCICPSYLFKRLLLFSKFFKRVQASCSFIYFPFLYEISTTQIPCLGFFFGVIDFYHWLCYRFFLSTIDFSTSYRSKTFDMPGFNWLLTV